MKKYTLALTFILLLFLLCSCSKPEPSPHGEIPTDEQVKITTQYPVYAKDVKTISFMVENHSDDELFYGVDWQLEKHTSHGWVTVPFIENAAFYLTGIQLAPGRMKSEILYLHMFDYSLTDGTYRILKEINDQYYAGEFSVGESPITDESPHGFVPLEKLPKKYSAEDALADGVVIRHPDGTMENADRIQPFFDQLAIGYDSQLRLGSFTDEGELVLTDLITEGYDSFHKQTKICFRRDNSRANGSEIDQKYFEALITDGETIALSTAYVWLEEDNQRQEIFELNGDWVGREECLTAIRENMKETETKTY